MDNDKNKEYDPFDEDDFFALGEDEDEESGDGADGDDGADEDADDDTDDADDDDGVDEEDEDEEGEDDDADDADGAGDSAPGGTDYGAMLQADFAEIAKAFPGIELRSASDLKNAKRFGELRDKGMTATEAFLATNHELLTARAEQHGAGKATGKAHLQSVAKKAGARASTQMTKQEREFAKNFFSDTMSDKDIENLWAKTRK